jgi:hypothetical protein
MMGVRTPETRWAVNKRQDNKLEKLLHLVDIFEFQVQLAGGKYDGQDIVRRQLQCKIEYRCSVTNPAFMKKIHLFQNAANMISTRAGCVVLTDMIMKRPFSGIWRRVAWQKFTDASAEHTASSFIQFSLFHSKYECDMNFRNVCNLYRLQDVTTEKKIICL